MARRRYTRGLKWLALAICVLLAGAWALTLRYDTWVQPTRHYLVGLVGGSLLFEKTPPSPHPGLRPVLRPASVQYWWPELNRAEHIQKTYWDWYVRVPLWLLLVVGALCAALLFWRDRPRPGPGHCRHCGYNLTGNVTGRCPECGSPA